MVLSGSKMAGGNPEHGRSDLDFYATNPKDVENFLKMLYRDHIIIPGNRFLEPCAGGGHIVEACISSPYLKVNQVWDTIDIVDRGYPLTKQADFLTLNISSKYDCIISNPPYVYAADFIKKCYNLLSENGILAMFLKLQFLESEERRELFQTHPPKYVYVLRSRTAAWYQGKEFNPETGKPWSGTITYCWFVWQKGSISEPIIRWVDDVDYTASKRLF